MTEVSEVRRMEPRMQLHLGKCIEDLDELHNVPDLKTKRTTVLCKTALKLFEKAEEARCNGDEEYAYVYYMKYLRVVAFLSKEKECQKDKPYFSNMLGTKNPNKAIDAAEKLKKSLIERYEEELKGKEGDAPVSVQERHKTPAPEAAEPSESAPAPTAGLPSANEVMIKCEQLYPLLKAGKLKIMVLDARPGSDFLASHVGFPSCISVPEECISPGQSANVLEQNLPLTSRKVWAERATMELIVMLDWNSTTLIPGKTLFLLKTILLKWDIKVQYARPPLALWGGYEDWLLKYPAATTNPQVTPPSQHDLMEDMLGCAARAARAAGDAVETREDDDAASGGEPPTSVPNYFALDHPHPSCSEDEAEKSAAAAAAAAAGGEPPSPNSRKRDHPSSSEDEGYSSSPPKKCRSDIEYPNWADLNPPPAATAPSTPSTPCTPAAPRAVKPGEPVVDRASKVAAVQLYEERSRAMQLLLEKQERIADSALSLELKRIEAEQKWQRVRSQRETEQRDELRAMYQLREQEISSQLMQLENKQYDMEQENQQLREKLEEYQRREREEQERMAGETTPVGQEPDRQRLMMEQAAKSRQMAAKRARIAAVTSQRDQLDRRREAMENERKRKLAEAREKRKPDLDKDEDGDTYMSSPGDGPVNLSRSVSSPDLMPGSDEEEPAAAAPTFDRSTKPRRIPPADLRPRDFEPMFGSSGRGLTGLRNMGNTCYMNSIIQCLNNTDLLVRYFCDGNYMDHINRSHSTRGAVAEEMAAVVRALWSEQYRYVGIKDFKAELGKHHRAFGSCEQQDSHEFLTILMDLLHNDLQFPVKPPNRDNLTPPERAWLDFTKCKESLILRLFYGQIKSTVCCVVCGKQSVTYESFSNLSLELPTLPALANRCTLADCLRLYLNGETIHGWNCPGCKEKREAVKKLDISRLPPVLVIHFKRFYANAAAAAAKDAFTKKMTYIDFPLSGLDMRPFSLHVPPKCLYDLYAVSNHYGSMQNGHYTATCKNSVHNKWYQYDDHQVLEISDGEVKSSAAYILFYVAAAAAQRAQGAQGAQGV